MYIYFFFLLDQDLSLFDLIKYFGITDNLNADLLIEKSKVSELETQIKASDISEQITRALEVHMKKSVVSLKKYIFVC